MSEPHARERRWKLIRAVAAHQVKLLLGAARDLVLVPVSLFAASMDLVLAHRQAPRFFQWTLEIGRRIESRLDQWPRATADDMAVASDIDALLQHLEDVVRDPKSGKDKARMLSRWARMQRGRSRGKASVD